MRRALLAFAALGAAFLLPLSASLGDEFKEQQDALSRCGRMSHCSTMALANPQAARLINACARALQGGSYRDAELCDDIFFGRLMFNQTSTRE